MSRLRTTAFMNVSPLAPVPIFGPPLASPLMDASSHASLREFVETAARDGSAALHMELFQDMESIQLTTISLWQLSQALLAADGQ